MLTIPNNAAPRQSARKLTPAEAGALGMSKRLSAEDWQEMTAAANRSARHVKSMERWRELARQRNASLTPEQVDKLAERLRRDFYVAMGRRSGAARAARAARRAEAGAPAETAE